MPTMIDCVLCLLGFHSYGEWRPDPFNAKYEVAVCVCCGKEKRRKVI